MMTGILGITGGIGSGKSYISALLSSQFGVPVYDCDSAAKRLNDEDPNIRHALIRLVGEQVYAADGHLNRPVLAAYLFASQEHQQQVDAIIHPVVRSDFKQWRSRQSSPLVALESAILYESGFNRDVDRVLMVTAPVEMRIQRAMQRDGVKREQIQARIALQQTDEFVRRADYVIENNKQSDSELIAALRQIIEKN